MESLDLDPALLFGKACDHRDLKHFTLIGFDTEIDLHAKADEPNTYTDDDEGKDKGQHK